MAKFSDMKGKGVVITGGAIGIGFAAAKRFASEEAGAVINIDCFRKIINFCVHNKGKMWYNNRSR